MSIKRIEDVSNTQKLLDIIFLNDHSELREKRKRTGSMRRKTSPLLDKLCGNSFLIYRQMVNVAISVGVLFRNDRMRRTEKPDERHTNCLENGDQIGNLWFIYCLLALSW